MSSPAPSPTIATSTMSVPAPQTTGPTGPSSNVTWVCQETFHADNTTSCLRYPKVKRCITEGQTSNQTFLCVDHDSISVGGSGPVPLPAGISPFMCTMTSCPLEAPAKEKPTPTNNGNNGSGNGKSGAMGLRSTETVKWTGVLVLAMLVVPMVLGM
ncbi:hypothetical protein BKA57DRAFT_452038 [Linnemannia elongata]|nr:hypothetical protein BKA57DRAFT_452038 [Linnemannia elongata]